MNQLSLLVVGWLQITNGDWVWFETDAEERRKVKIVPLRYLNQVVFLMPMHSKDPCIAIVILYYWAIWIYGGQFWLGSLWGHPGLSCGWPSQLCGDPYLVLSKEFLAFEV